MFVNLMPQQPHQSALICVVRVLLTTFVTRKIILPVRQACAFIDFQ